MPCPSRLLCFSFPVPGCSVLAVSFLLSYSGCPVQTVLFWLSCSNSSLLIVQLGLSCFFFQLSFLAARFGCSDLAVLFWLSFSSYLTLDALLGYLVLSVLFWSSLSGFPALVVLFRLSCSGCPDLAFMFWLSWAIFLDLAVLIWLFCLGCPTLVVPYCSGSLVLPVSFLLSWFRCPEAVNSSCAALAVLFLISFPGSLFPAVLFRLFYSSCAVLAVLVSSWNFMGESYRIFADVEYRITVKTLVRYPTKCRIPPSFSDVGASDVKLVRYRRLRYQV